VAIQGINHIAYQSIHFVISMGQGRWLEGVIESSPVDEEAVLAKNLFENVSFHFLSPEVQSRIQPPSYSGRVGVGERGFSARMQEVIRLSEKNEILLDYHAL
jgi:hypothetical protein